MTGVRTFDRDVLVRRYGLSQRVASRVVALLGRQVDATEALLELAASEPALADTLLDRSVLGENGAAVEQGALQALARENGLECADSLRVVPGEDGWQTIAMEDDLLAEQAAEGAERLAELAVARAAGQESINLAESSTLFGPEEVARLKLEALTSQRAEVRAESLRKLVFAPIPVAEKARIFVDVLVDPSADARVRQEAVRSLERIGFDPELSETLSRLFNTDEEEVLYAVDRLDVLLKGAEEAERTVALAVLLEQFCESQPPRVEEKLLDMIASMASTLVRSPQKTEQFIQAALRRLVRDFERLWIPVERAILGCQSKAPESVVPMLLREMGRSADARVRTFLVEVTAAGTRDHETLSRLAEVALDEMLNPQLPERQRSRLRYGLVRLGEPAARAVLDALRRQPSAMGPELIRLLDVLCTEAEVSRKVVNEAAQYILETLQLGERESRRVAMDAALCADDRVKVSLRVKMAKELLANLVELRSREVAETICGRLEAIGPPALKPLADFLARRYPREESEWAFVAIGRIARSRGQDVPKKTASEVLAFCSELLQNPDSPIGAFAICTAYLCGYTAEGAAQFDRILQTMFERLGKASYTCEVLDGMVVMAGSANAGPQHQQQLFEIFERVASMKGPERLGVRRKTEEGTVYEFGREIFFDTRLLPAAVRGLGCICVSEACPTELRKEVVKRLLTLWEGVSKARVIWGPGAVGALIQAMCTSACSELLSVQMRVRLGHSLLRFPKRLAVVRSVGEICSRPASDVALQNLCVEAGKTLLAEWEECQVQDDERRQALLLTLGKLAANPGLDADDVAVQHMRSNIVDALFLALRGPAPGVRQPLELLRDCPTMPKDQRTEIDERLRRAFSLVKREPS